MRDDAAEGCRAALSWRVHRSRAQCEEWAIAHRLRGALDGRRAEVMQRGPEEAQKLLLSC